MRLGILGPANDDMIGLARAAQFLLDEAHAEKVIYLSDDGAMERVVVSWARELVGPNPSGEALFKRAAARCAKASPVEIDNFVESERARVRLGVFYSLPSGESRTIEILDGRVVVFVYDKATLDEEDIAAAQVLVYGKSKEPLIKRVGARVFVTPGPIGSPSGGAAVLDDGAEGVRVEIIGPGGAVTAHDQIGGPRPGKMRVQGGT
ncbi:MAG: hypothetical protein QM820_11485 [Minicystis sp.]